MCLRVTSAELVRGGAAVRRDTGGCSVQSLPKAQQGVPSTLTQRSAAHHVCSFDVARKLDVYVRDGSPSLKYYVRLIPSNGLASISYVLCGLHRLCFDARGQRSAYPFLLGGKDPRYWKLGPAGLYWIKIETKIVFCFPLIRNGDHSRSSEFEIRSLSCEKNLAPCTCCMRQIPVLDA